MPEQPTILMHSLVGLALEQPTVAKLAFSKALANDLVLDWAGKAPTVETGQEPKVVLQSIAAGTPIKKGTAINLTLAAKSAVPGAVIGGIYGPWKEMTLGDIEAVALKDAEVVSIIDKYSALARDAQLSGDRVAAENFLQHAEHYARNLIAVQEAQAERREQHQQNQNQQPQGGPVEGGRGLAGRDHVDQAPDHERPEQGQARAEQQEQGRER